MCIFQIYVVWLKNASQQKLQYMIIFYNYWQYLSTLTLLILNCVVSKLFNSISPVKHATCRAADSLLVLHWLSAITLNKSKSRCRFAHLKYCIKKSELTLDRVHTGLPKQNSLTSPVNHTTFSLTYIGTNFSTETAP